MRRWIAVGLIAAGLTGIGALVVGFPFMTAHTAHLHLPLLGEIHIPTAMFLDIGVFALVVGSTLLILTAMAHQSIRRQRKPVREEGATSESVAHAVETSEASETVAEEAS